MGKRQSLGWCHHEARCQCGADAGRSTAKLEPPGRKPCPGKRSAMGWSRVQARSKRSANASCTAAELEPSHRDCGTRERAAMGRTGVEVGCVSWCRSGEL